MPTDPKDNSSRELFEQRRAMIDWAKQEKADIESGAKKPPTTSLEKFMADRDKPLKTALVREVIPGRNRSHEAKKRAEYRTSTRPHAAWLNNPKTRDMSRTASAVETYEAQAFVGQMKPGVEARTALHSINDWAERMETRRQASYEHQHQKPGGTWGHTKTYVEDELFKDLGEAVPGEAKAQGLRARAEARATRQKRSEARKAAGKIAGVAPTIDISPRAQGWDKVKAWEIGDLPKTD